MPDPKKAFVDDVTIVSGNMLSSIFGGVDGYQSDPSSPYKAGHFHDGRNDEWGHAPLIDLTDHVTGRFVSPTLELKSIKLAPTQATPLTSSLFWTLPIPSDAYIGTAQPMFLNIFWSGNNALNPGNAAFRVDWFYLQAGQNVMPPSIIDLGDGYWPANTIGANNPTPATFRFKVSASPSRLYVNDTLTGGHVIQLTLPSNVPGSTLGDFLLLGLEITTAPTVTLTQPMSLVNIFGVELMYYSQTLGTNTTLTMLQNDQGLGDF